MSKRSSQSRAFTYLSSLRATDTKITLGVFPPQPDLDLEWPGNTPSSSPAPALETGNTQENAP
jgi:hypothetical protein